MDMYNIYIHIIYIYHHFLARVKCMEHRYDMIYSIQKTWFGRTNRMKSPSYLPHLPLVRPFQGVWCSGLRTSCDLDTWCWGVKQLGFAGSFCVLFGPLPKIGWLFIRKPPVISWSNCVIKFFDINIEIHFDSPIASPSAGLGIPDLQGFLLHVGCHSTPDPTGVGSPSFWKFTLWPTVGWKNMSVPKL